MRVRGIRLHGRKWPTEFMQYVSFSFAQLFNPASKVAAVLSKINNFLVGQSPSRLKFYSFLLIAIIGSLDFLTGYELSFSIFYLIPVGIASWYLEQRLGKIICITAALTWLIVDFTSGHQYIHPAVPYWNACVRFGFFVIVAYLLGRIRLSLEQQTSLARFDGLTGMLNVRSFRQRCESLFELAFRHERPIALGYLDLDGFKGINDKLGHSAGDQVLKEIASLLSKRLRTSDVGARLGGDEFAVLLPETSLLGAQTYFEELHKSLLNLAADKRWPLGFSIGVAVFQKRKISPDSAINFTDELMYKVKKSGKNNILIIEFDSKPEGDPW